MREMITVRDADHELRIQVVDARAYVAIVPTGADEGGADRVEHGGFGGGHDEPGPGVPEPSGTHDAACRRVVSLPARRLHALLRSAWADDQYGSVGPLDPPLWPADEPEPEEDPYRLERMRFGWRDDWPDDAADAPGELVPLPGRADSREGGTSAARVPPPANSGLPWPPEDDAALRDVWLTADPGTARPALVRELGRRFGRSPGAVVQRLYRVGCDPACLGVARMTPAAPAPITSITSGGPATSGDEPPLGSGVAG